jgi:hypothetical protein
MTAMTLRRTELYWAPLLAAGLALLAAIVGWQGVDLPASLYRVSLFHRDGLTLWDSQWYGGHWTLNYSVIFPPVAGLLGVWVTAIASAMGAAFTFDRLAIGHFGRSARVGSLIFAVGTLAQVAIGQLPFLLGEALALGALWLATRHRWTAAIALAFAAALASPLAGAFLSLAAMAWLISSWPRVHRGAAALLIAPATPVIISTLLFPGQGDMPFPATDFLFLLGLFGLAALLVPARERTLRIGAVLYLVAIAASFVLPSAVGGNISRLGECIGAPLLACLLWPDRRRWLLAIALPIATLQWGPATSTFFSNGANPSSDAVYFQPVIRFLQQHSNPAGRVEIVPTQLHWEAADVAPYVPLARGWERQLDTQNNPIFYTGGAALDPVAYRAWLLDNGVRYVALPDVALDYAAVAEGNLLRRGVPGLRPVFSNAHWRIFAVTGSSGIVSGPARLTRQQGTEIVLNVSAPGSILLRTRYSPDWAPAETTACLAPAAGGWTTVVARQAGVLHLQLGLVGRSSGSC